jgi:hypothetical protein
VMCFVLLDFGTFLSVLCVLVPKSNKTKIITMSEKF